MTRPPDLTQDGPDNSQSTCLRPPTLQKRKEMPPQLHEKTPREEKHLDFWAGEGKHSAKIRAPPFVPPATPVLPTFGRLFQTSKSTRVPCAPPQLHLDGQPKCRLIAQRYTKQHTRQKPRRRTAVAFPCRHVTYGLTNICDRTLNT